MTTLQSVLQATLVERGCINLQILSMSALLPPLQWPEAQASDCRGAALFDGWVCESFSFLNFLRELFMNKAQELQGSRVVFVMWA